MNEKAIECRAIRRGRGWTVHSAEHSVYGHGSTLKRARASVEQGLAHIGITTEVTLIPVSPELDMLRAADKARAAALVEAVKALALRRATMGDIAAATGTPRSQVKKILASLKDAPTPAVAARSSEQEQAEDEYTCAEDPSSACSPTGQRHVHPAVSDRPGVHGPHPSPSEPR
ncbi:hypothetical protein [Streptomyces vietnamensis]|uniref:hypothetical protein n=1 Tax=Streptomyces vietnamensis TaxID=362257 RepID=UPI003430824B